MKKNVKRNLAVAVSAVTAAVLAALMLVSIFRRKKK